MVIILIKITLRCRLLLNSVHEDDSGTYTCKLSTAKGEPAKSETHCKLQLRASETQWF